MIEPENYALVDTDGVVINVIWLLPSNCGDFPEAVRVGDRPVAIGDMYLDGEFWRDGEIVMPPPLA